MPGRLDGDPGGSAGVWGHGAERASFPVSGRRGRGAGLQAAAPGAPAASSRVRGQWARLSLPSVSRVRPRAPPRAVPRPRPGTESGDGGLSSGPVAEGAHRSAPRVVVWPGLPARGGRGSGLALGHQVIAAPL